MQSKGQIRLAVCGLLCAAAVRAQDSPLPRDSINFNLPKDSSPKTVTDLERTSSYPHGMDGRARFTAHERTTSYRQPMYSDRRVYDTIN